MASGASGARPNTRMFVCTVARSMAMRAALCKTVCDQAGVRMVLDQARHVVVQREDTGCSKDSDLSHGAAHHAAVANRTGDDVT